LRKARIVLARLSLGRLRNEFLMMRKAQDPDCHPAWTVMMMTTGQGQDDPLTIGAMRTGHDGGDDPLRMMRTMTGHSAHGEDGAMWLRPSSTSPSPSAGNANWSWLTG
jgi:hypothetical protein